MDGKMERKEGGNCKQEIYDYEGYDGMEAYLCMGEMAFLFI